MRICGWRTGLGTWRRMCWRGPCSFKPDLDGWRPNKTRKKANPIWFALRTVRCCRGRPTFLRHLRHFKVWLSANRGKGNADQVKTETMELRFVCRRLRPFLPATPLRSSRPANPSSHPIPTSNHPTIHSSSHPPHSSYGDSPPDTPSFCLFSVAVPFLFIFFFGFFGSVFGLGVGLGREIFVLVFCLRLRFLGQVIELFFRGFKVGMPSFSFCLHKKWK